MIIATSDWHLSSIKPPCRTETDWLAAQGGYLDLLVGQVVANNATLYVAGDVFDTSTVSPSVVNMVLDKLTGIHAKVIAGNHDLPYHSIAKIEDSSFGAIRKFVGTAPYCYDFGTEEPAAMERNGKARIVMLHHFSVPAKADCPPGRDAYTADDLMSMFPDANIIIVGDNHQPWQVKKRNQLVVNCGTLIKRTATEAKFPCGVWLIDDEHIEAKYIDYSELNKENIDLSYMHIDREKEELAAEYAGLVSELKDSLTQRYDFPSILQEFVHAHEKELTPETYEFVNGVLEYIKED